MKKRWLFIDEPDKNTVASLSRAININEYLAKILVQRGITSFEEARDFFRPDLSMLYDPFEMKGMDRAVNRLSEAIFQGEKILLYGDYDVDGITSVSLLYSFLSEFSDHVEYYIPDRYTEGYGVSKKGVEHAINNEVTLIITLDCGIRAFDRIKELKEKHIDVIVCDHHIPGAKSPPALAILDPKQEACNYPFKELSGCGIGFKLLEGFCDQNTIDRSKLETYLDFVAVSIASDIVPIVDENRVLAFFGLKKLNEDPSFGLASLMKIADRKPPLTITDVVFSLGPRINATGRLTHAEESVNLLIGKSEKLLLSAAENMNDRNRERRELDRSITEEALEMIAQSSADAKSTVLFKKDWHQGVVGIVASRCIEHFYRPTIILTESKGKATGSARSVDGFDIYNAISQCEELLDQYGGHMYAAGLTLNLEKVETFRRRFEEIVSAKITADQRIPKIKIDTLIPLDALTFKAANIIAQMEPFGPGNMSPVFGTEKVYFKDTPKIIKDKHIKGFMVAEGSRRVHEYIGFGLAEKLQDQNLENPFKIAYHLEINSYMEDRRLVLNLKDIVFDS